MAAIIKMTIGGIDRRARGRENNPTIALGDWGSALRDPRYQALRQGGY